jgi:N-acetylmuramoyl-L-alanine amidase
MRTGAVRLAQQLMLLLVVLAVAAVGLSVWQAARDSEGPVFLQRLLGPPQTLAGYRLGVVAGHSGNDSGAVCPDGLQEVEVNLVVTDALAGELRARGAQVDVLEEFDRRLPGYRADAFISIHADSCELELSGFKVASLEESDRASERLVACLWQHYEAVTGLKPHPDTITYDMRDYHAFREIAPDTPAAIIEIGFLWGDRELLTGAPDRVAAGIAAGIGCFLTRSE